MLIKEANPEREKISKTGNKNCFGKTKNYTAKCLFTTKNFSNKIDFISISMSENLPLLKNLVYVECILIVTMLGQASEGPLFN